MNVGSIPITRSRKAEGPHCAGWPLHGPNRWPAGMPWLRSAAEAYFDETLALGKRLLRVFAVYVSNQHRVVNRTGKERFSIPTFFNLDYDAPVSCLPNCRSADRPAKYQPIKSGDYLLSRFRDVQKFKGDERAQTLAGARITAA